MLIVLYWGCCCGLDFQSFGSEHMIEKEESKTGEPCSVLRIELFA